MADDMRVLVVHDRALDQISPALQAGAYQVVRVMSPAGDMCLHALESEPELIVLDIRVLTAALLEQLQRVNHERPCPVVVFTDDADSAAIRKAIAVGVSAYIVDGLYVKRLQPILDVAIARFKEMHAMRVELDSARRSLADRKRIDRAKGILMQRRGISEDAAYHSLRKLAMERNQKIGDVADSVITAAELLG